ncbi:MAG: hypothetical protein HYR96_16160 [Deltaproteobacteria bacterium]|nr:hypothetical protein [Deltaproteobacteria bacterium]
MRNELKVLVSVFVFLGLASPVKAGPPVVEVRVRPEDREVQFVAGETKVGGVNAPYALLKPEPFIYSTDATEQKRIRGFETRPFVVAGLNCDKTIKHVATITGVEVETLSRRARPGNQSPDTDKAWKGINNRNVRSSFDGFLKNGQSIVDVLAEDNETVRGAGITHQMVAAPILTALEHMSVMVDEGTDWDPEVGFEVKYEGHKYTVKEGTLGLLYFPGLAYDDDMKKVEEKDLPKMRAKARKKVKSYHSGWTGAGVQGSFFNDEIYSSCNLSFTREDGKTLAIDCLTPHLIYRYGFYQGGPYRKDPSDIIKFFGLQANAEVKANWKACD